MIAVPPYIVQEDIKDSHRDRSDELSGTESSGEVFQSGSAQRECARHQVKRVAQSKDNSHDAKQTILSVPVVFADHQDSKCDDGDQIYCVK